MPFPSSQPHLPQALRLLFPAPASTVKTVPTDSASVSRGCTLAAPYLRPAPPTLGLPHYPVLEYCAFKLCRSKVWLIGDGIWQKFFSPLLSQMDCSKYHLYLALQETAPWDKEISSTYQWWPVHQGSLILAFLPSLSHLPVPHPCFLGFYSLIKR